MNARSSQNSATPEPMPKGKKEAGSYGLAWTFLPVMLLLSFVVLLIFGASWWTALVVILLLACPAVIAIALYLGQRTFPRVSRPNRDARTLRREGKPEPR